MSAGERQIRKAGVIVREVSDYNVHDGEFFPMKSYSAWFYLIEAKILRIKMAKTVTGI